ncbi:MAG: ATP-binding protein [Isosphaeraceae bacterium]
MSEATAAVSDVPPFAADSGGSELNQRLRTQFDEIAQLAGGLAHEVRNPLSTMRLNLDLLAEDFQGAETPRDRRVLQKIERVRKESHRLQEIVENFLQFARIREVALHPADLNVVVDEMRDFCEPQAACQGIVMRTYYAPDLPAVSMNPDLFKQAILNLILNAQHAMPQGGELLLTTRGDGPAVVLDVTDTGCGIPPESHPRIFEPFFSTRPGGTGLGLSYTRRIIEAHGGSISLESEPGKGSKFTIRLPIVNH